MSLIRYIILFIISFLLFISCATKDASLRNLDDVHKAESSLVRYNENEDIIQAQVAYSDFVKLSVEDPDFNVRALALYGVGSVRGKSVDAIDSVRRAINDTNLQVQIEALKVAGILNEPRLLNSILESLSSKNKWVRITAVEALKDYKDNRVDRSLKLLLSTDSDLAVKSAIKQVLEYREKNINN